VASECGFLENQNVIIEKAIPAELERERGAMITGSTIGSLDRPISEIIRLKVRAATTYSLKLVKYTSVDWNVLVGSPLLVGCLGPGLRGPTLNVALGPDFQNFVEFF